MYLFSFQLNVFTFYLLLYMLPFMEIIEMISFPEVSSYLKNC